MGSRIIPGYLVAVTGLGVISPVGLTVDSFWQALVNGHSGIAPIRDLDPSGLEVSVAAQLKGFEPVRYTDRKEARRSDRFCQLAIAAAREAITGSSTLRPMAPIEPAPSSVTAASASKQSSLNTSNSMRPDLRESRRWPSR